MLGCACAEGEAAAGNAARGADLGIKRAEKPAQDARPARLSAPFVALGSATPIKIIAAICRSKDAKKNDLAAVPMREVLLFKLPCL